MILDVHGTIRMKIPGQTIEVLRERILKALKAQKTGVTIKQDGEILIKGSWFNNLNPFSQRLGGLEEGKINCVDDGQGYVKITYFYSLMIGRIFCFMISLSTILLYLLDALELIPLIMLNLLIWLWIYGILSF